MLYLGAVQAEHHPVLRMMPSVANVDSYATEAGVEHRVSGGTLHVVSGLVEVAHAGNVVLPLFADHLAVVSNHHGGVPQSVAVLSVPLQNGTDDDHPMALGKLAHQDYRWPVHGVLGQFAPRVLLSGAEGERHG